VFEHNCRIRLFVDAVAVVVEVVGMNNKAKFE
jgi:hypothetical protein